MRWRIVRTSLVALLVLLAVGVVGGYLWLSGSGRPLRQGEVTLEALDRPVDVRFDGWAVPHVKAESPDDLLVALGWLHANERMTQMELGRRFAFGRLSEVLGEATVELDRKSRILRLGATAEMLWSQAGPQSRRYLEAYARGVNLWLEQRGADLPPTLRLLGIEPEPWQPAHSLAFVLLMANDLSFWLGRPEEVRYTWLRAFGAEAVRGLLGDPDLHVPEEIEALAAAEGAPVRSGAERVPDLYQGAPGSNNWALGSSRTLSGRPLVANDPHLPLRLPGVWYQVLLRSPGYEVAGMSLPGVPGVVIGRSRYLGWGFTNTMLDDHDLFFEELDEGGTRVRRGESWLPLREERQVIRVKGGQDVPLVLRSTDRGPLLEADAELGLPPRSLVWTLYLPSDPVAAFVGIAQATSVSELLEGLGSYVGPAQNLVVGHRDGALALTVLGRIPHRLTGDGRLPSPGWNPSYGWQGTLPRIHNPTLLFPSDDFLVTANNDFRPQDLPVVADDPMSADFDSQHRARRIRELLASRDDWSPKAVGAVQLDTVSLYAREVVAALAGVAVSHGYTGRAERAWEMLEAWDGTMGRGGKSRGSERGDDDRAAALFLVVERELGEAIFGDEAERGGVASPASWELIGRALDGDLDPRWLDDVRTPGVEGLPEVAQGALEAAWTWAMEHWGRHPESWTYVGHHTLTLEHPLGALPMVGRWFNRGPLPVPGSATTPAAFGGRWRGDGQWVAYGPSMRWVVDTGNLDQGLAVLPGGQSGHPFDAHYDDQLPLYLNGGLRPVPWSDEAIERVTRSRLRLLPGPPPQTP